jgi:hypothetical protein
LRLFAFFALPSQFILSFRRQRDSIANLPARRR